MIDIRNSDKKNNASQYDKNLLDAAAKRHCNRLVKHMLLSFATIGAVSTAFVLKNSADFSHLFPLNHILDIIPHVPIDVAINHTVAICFSVLGAELAFVLLSHLYKHLIYSVKSLKSKTRAKLKVSKTRTISKIIIKN